MFVEKPLSCFVNVIGAPTLSSLDWFSVPEFVLKSSKFLISSKDTTTPHSHTISFFLWSITNFLEPHI